MDLKTTLFHVALPTGIVALSSTSLVAPFASKFIPVTASAIACTALISAIHGLTLAYFNQQMDEREQIRERRLRSVAVIILTSFTYIALNPLGRPKNSLWDINLITLISGLMIGYAMEPRIKTRQEKKVIEIEIAFDKIKKEIADLEAQLYYATEMESASQMSFNKMIGKGKKIPSSGQAPEDYQVHQRRVKTSLKEAQTKKSSLEKDLEEKKKFFKHCKEELTKAKANIPGTEEELNKRAQILDAKEKQLNVANEKLNNEIDKFNKHVEKLKKEEQKMRNTYRMLKKALSSVKPKKISPPQKLRAARGMPARMFVKGSKRSQS